MACNAHRTAAKPGSFRYAASALSSPSFLRGAKVVLARSLLHNWGIHFY
jgi:hypothetical protein